MRQFVRRAGVPVAVAAALASVLPFVATTRLAQATAARRAEPNHAVFVQTNDPQSNTVVAFGRYPDGTLKQVASYPTGGAGGREMGATSDPLASQGSLLFDPADGLLFAANAGSNTISVFGVDGDTLHLRQTVNSGGSFPVGFARSGSLLYVLNAGLAGNLTGFRIVDGRLDPIDGSMRSLRLANAATPFFLSSPAQVAFTPAGNQLVVSTKTNGTADVFGVNTHGLLSVNPVQNPVGGIPFGLSFDTAGQLVLVNAATLSDGAFNPNTSSVTTYGISPGGTLTAVSGPVTDGQTAACWSAEAQGFDYIANTGSGSLSQYLVGTSGAVTLIQATVASGIPGPTDLASEGAVLYNLSALSSSVEVFAVNTRGALTLIQTVPVPDASSEEGVVAF